DRYQQPAKSAGERVLRILVFFEFGWIGYCRSVDLDLACLGACLGHLRQHLALLRRIALHCLDQIGNQIGTTLVLVLHIRPLRLRAFVIGRDVVDTTARKQQSGEQGEKWDAGATQDAYQMAHATPPHDPFLKSALPISCDDWSVSLSFLGGITLRELDRSLF